MTVLVTAQEVTARLGQEMGVLTVNSIMQTIQIEKMGAKIAEDALTIERLSSLNEDLRTQVNTLAAKVLPPRTGSRSYKK